MTFDNRQQPGQIPLPPPEKKPTGNRRNGWLYIGLGVLFLILGGIGLLGDDADLLDWAFLVLGIANASMGIVALTKGDPKIDPFATKD
ncbi:hypothetical protein MWU75_17535 [Ornithinimicrobium sp. F0845]|uniref:hypothetical protein n=1 Tax=Ornithinimicrobium sp. F0845 TaxID=2926412 RepID=UPI001FF1FA11|nr:hypothetical protein [Ornithinimicrobium sp. F0845]MCK0113947.1 hypothetical protein [Ornithinimicrobium sp. F0845]